MNLNNMLIIIADALAKSLSSYFPAFFLFQIKLKGFTGLLTIKNL